MPAPILSGPPNEWGRILDEYLQEIETRLAVLEGADSPKPVFACTTANMPSAATYIGCVLRNTTINILAHSDGTAWRREDTGAVI